MGEVDLAGSNDVPTAAEKKTDDTVVPMTDSPAAAAAAVAAPAGTPATPLARAANPPPYEASDYSEFLSDPSGLGARSGSNVEMTNRTLSKFLDIDQFALPRDTPGVELRLSNLLDEEGPNFGSLTSPGMLAPRGLGRMLDPPAAAPGNVADEFMNNQGSFTRFLEGSVVGSEAAPDASTPANPLTKILDQTTESWAPPPPPIPLEKTPSGNAHERSAGKDPLRKLVSPIAKDSGEKSISPTAVKAIDAQVNEFNANLPESAAIVAQSNILQRKGSSPSKPGGTAPKTLPKPPGKATPRPNTPSKSPLDSDDDNADSESFGDFNQLCNISGGTSVGKEKLSTEERKRRRAESNRLSAERSRERRKQYLRNLEIAMKNSQAETADLRKVLTFYQQQVKVLQEIIRLNGSAEQKLAAAAVDDALQRFQQSVPQVQLDTLRYLPKAQAVEPKLSAASSPVTPSSMQGAKQ